MSEETMEEWLRDKLVFLNEEYQRGFGYGDVYESQYLCYLECLAVAKGQDPENFWNDWKAVIRATGKLSPDEVLLPMNRIVGDDRPALIKALEGFKRRWVDGPTPRRAVPKTTTPKVEVQEAPEVPEVQEVALPETPSGEPPKLGTGRPEGLGKKGKRGKRADYVGDGSIFDLMGG